MYSQDCSRNGNHINPISNLMRQGAYGHQVDKQDIFHLLTNKSWIKYFISKLPLIMPHLIQSLFNSIFTVILIYFIKLLNKILKRISVKRYVGVKCCTSYSSVIYLSLPIVWKSEKKKFSNLAGDIKKCKFKQFLTKTINYIL